MANLFIRCIAVRLNPSFLKLNFNLKKYLKNSFITKHKRLVKIKFKKNIHKKEVFFCGINIPFYTFAPRLNGEVAQLVRAQDS